MPVLKKLKMGLCKKDFFELGFVIKTGISQIMG
jgi:hypothetical protein